MDAAKFIGKQKIKRYSTSFSRLLMLILDMSEAQQLTLLNHAKDIVSGLQSGSSVANNTAYSGHHEFGWYVAGSEIPIPRECHLLSEGLR